MFKTIKLFLLSALFSSSIYAIEATHTNEIIDTAIDATQTIQIEMDEVIEDSTTIEEIISQPVTIMETEVEMIETETMPIAAIETITPTLITTEQTNNDVVEKKTKILEITTPLLPAPTIQADNISTLETNTTQLSKSISTEQGDSTKGRNIFKYVLKDDCGMTGYKFAGKYTQEEWEELAEEHKFKETLFKTCPNVKLYYKDRWTVDLYKFFYEISNDEEGIPEC